MTAVTVNIVHTPGELLVCGFLQMVHHKQWLVVGSVILNMLLMMYIALLQHQYLSDNSCDDNFHNKNHHARLSMDKCFSSHSSCSLAKQVTVVIRDFEMFDNVIIQTIQELYNILNDTKVLIVSDNVPYPPLQLDSRWNVKVISLTADLLRNYSSDSLNRLITTKYVLVLPDSARLKHWTHLRESIGMLSGGGSVKAVAIAVGQRSLSCLNIYVDVRRWQMTVMVKGNNSRCNSFLGDQALVMSTGDFLALTEPFARPFSFCFYVQAAVRLWKVRQYKRHQLGQVVHIPSDPHRKWKVKHLNDERLSIFYRRVGIKAVVQQDGKAEYYGCTKTSSRCFGTIINDMPEYLYQGKWTPPCCLRSLRETARYVFGILQKDGMRYWLEGGSLLGAVRSCDIIPWDYDVDIGIYLDDVSKSSFLVEAEKNRFSDNEGFVWERATEGEFFRVQYSEHNHLHVDIHPFYSKDGMMTKKSWFKTHRQDTEFPEHFLMPLTSILFVGINASAPNNCRKFLEFKFGRGVVEQPRYPNYVSVH